MVRKTVFLLGLGALLAAGQVMAGEIYKWTDEDGNVHYEDRPLGEGVERVNITSRGTDSQQVQAAIQARRDREDARLEARAKRDEDAKAALEAKAEAEERAAKCQENRARMESYLASRRLYKQDDSGERVYLDEDETMAARALVQEQIQKYCD